MEYFRADVKVGVFIFCSLALLAVAAIMVGKLGDLFAKKQYYTVLFPNANLFSTGTRVSYAGLPVGHVSEVELRSDAARAQQHQTYAVALTLAVKSGVVLHEDARVEMKTEGFIGTAISTFPLAPASRSPRAVQYLGRWVDWRACWRPSRECRVGWKDCSPLCTPCSQTRHGRIPFQARWPT
jgi:hypothetical protein